MRFITLLLQFVCIACTASLTSAAERVVFNFDDAAEVRAWNAVNDGVMGGRSEGRAKATQDGSLLFQGTLSLANNGGFSSIRARSSKLASGPDDCIVLRIRGDGRQYNLNLYNRSDLSGYSYRQSFATKANEWIEVSLPIKKFVANWRGRRFPNEKLDPSRIVGIGVLIGDKRPGPFRLEVDWIQVQPESDQSVLTRSPGSPK